MNSAKKEHEGCDVICRNHSARTERDLYRVCPSKLSKRELEDLYFALLENHLELKKTIHSQQERIKVLSAKVQRMTTTQKNAAGKERDCCTSKVLLAEQKESISELKKANERMADRIRLLNMRLCSAKQFLKRSPSQTSKFRNSTGPSTFKNNSLTVLSMKPNDSVSKNLASVSCQYIEKETGSPKTSRTIETITDNQDEKNVDVNDNHCEENKCRTAMEELKQKVVNLQEELSQSRLEYSRRICKLESDVSALRDENVRVRTARLQPSHDDHQQLSRRLREAEATISDLTMQLTIEKRKVEELDTSLKLANATNQMAKTIDNLTTFTQSKTKSPPEMKRLSLDSSHWSENKEAEPTSPMLQVPSPVKLKDETKHSKSDDSGYTEHNKSCEIDEDKIMVKTNTELLKTISELQNQVDCMKISAAAELIYDKGINSSKLFESYDVHIRDTDDEPNRDDHDDSRKHNVELAQKEVNPSCSAANSSKLSLAEFEVGGGAGAGVDLASTERRTTLLSATRPWEEFDDITKLTLETLKEQRDDHNKYQIPGPIPAINSSNPYKTQAKVSPYKKSKGPKKVSVEEKSVKIVEASNENILYDRDINDPMVLAKNDPIWTKVELKTDGDLKRCATEDSLEINRRRLECKEPSISNTRDDVACEIFSNENALPTAGSAMLSVGQQGKVNQTGIEVKDLQEHDFCESRARVCQCPSSARRDVSVFRTCSGTLRFHTTAHSGKHFRKCGCLVTDQIMVSKAVAPPNPTVQPLTRDSATYTKPSDVMEAATYNVSKNNRATSPDNTEHEISSLTDLPSEKDGKSTNVLSPGEEKGTMTLSESVGNTTDYGSLSEGELPTEIKPRKLSNGEMTCKKPITSPNSQMEATLQAIGEELARCRQLLTDTSTHPKEKKAWVVAGAGAGAGAGVLRRARAARALPHTRVHTCSFTLHLGTLVLSDEAVLCSRYKTLILTWKFYDQNVAMTRMRGDRVCVFDFSTEYDVNFDEDFLSYLKYREMPLTICEMNKQEEPFATCSLPLREALIHTNRRADLSLALMAGPGFSGSAGATPAGPREEVGVLDLWGLLRVDATLLHEISRAVAAAAGNEPQNTFVSYSVEDEHSEGLSQDMALMPRRGSSPPNTEFADTPTLWEKETVDTENANHEPPSKYNEQVVRYSSSGFIVSEVPANIRSSEEMKQAVGEMSRSPSSMGSLKTGKYSLNNENNEAQPISFKDLLKREKALSISRNSNTPLKADEFQHRLSLKCDNITKYLGSSKMAITPKKSVKYTDQKEEDELEGPSTPPNSVENPEQSIDITVLWLALNEECEAMLDPNVQKLYVAYTFLGRQGADLETPISLPKPQHYADKCYFNFKKTFYLHDADLPLLGHMARCRARSHAVPDPRDCIIFSVVSEPPEDPLGFTSCEDVGHAYLYLGDIVMLSGGGSEYTEVVAVHGATSGAGEAASGVLCVRLENLAVLRRCLALDRAP